MPYLERIERSVSRIRTTLVDFSARRERRSPPTQVSSEFLTNKEQGDWAEHTLLNAINQYSEQYVAVKYGRDDDIVAGEDGFKEFYEEYQNELDEIGKRPDILIFDKEDFPYEETNISQFPQEVLDELVPKAKCGIEVRSSAFSMGEYEAYMNEKMETLTARALELQYIILNDFGELLREKKPELYEMIQSLSADNLHMIQYRCPSWRQTAEQVALSEHLKKLKQTISDIDKRTFLSITPKVEDLKVVYTWVKRYQVPHYYVQVFFDRAYGISFEKILDLIGDPALEEVKYFIESDVKNQNKTTIKIKASEEEKIMEEVSLPEYSGEMKELGRGRLLFYVKFEDSTATLDGEAFHRLFGFEL